MVSFRESFKSRFKRQKISATPESTSPALALALRPAASPSSALENLVAQEVTTSDTNPVVETDPPPGSTSSSLWDRAYDALCEEQPDLIARYQACLQQYLKDVNVDHDCNPSLESAAAAIASTDPLTRRSALSAISDVGLERAKTRGTYTLFGKSFNARDQMADISSSFRWIQTLVGEALKASPEASIAFAGVGIIVPLLASPQIAEEANQEGFIYVTSRMKYYIALEAAVKEALDSHSQNMTSLMMEVQGQALELYKDIIDFQIRSVLRFFESWVKTAGRDVLRPQEWQDKKARIQALEETLYKDLQTSLQLASFRALESCRDQASRIQTELSRICTIASDQLHTLRNTEHTVGNIHRKQLSDDQRKCLQTFALTQGGDEKSYEWYKGRVDSRAEGTCQWFLTHDSYTSWLASTSGPLLVTADPGCGKSVLAKALVDRDLPRDATIAYFFFKDQSQDCVSQALCALLHQLLSSPKGSGLVHYAMKPWESYGPSLASNTDQLFTILGHVLNDQDLGPIIIVIDALDECKPDEVSCFIDFWAALLLRQHQSSASQRCIMTSRPYYQVTMEFRELLEAFPQLHIPGEKESDALQSEINCVIKARSQSLASDLGWPLEMEQYLRAKLLAVPNRTYLWVYLVFDFMRQRSTKIRKTIDGLDGILSVLPRGVNEAYERILVRVEAEDVGFVRKALSMVLVAFKPLTVTEMNEALHSKSRYSSYDAFRSQLEEDDDFEQRLRACCGLLLSVHHGKVYFLHQTVREFLLASSGKMPDNSSGTWHGTFVLEDACLVMTECCTAYLSLLSLEDSLAPEVKELGWETPQTLKIQYKYLEHARNYWSEYFKRAQRAQHISKFIDELGFNAGYSGAYGQALLLAPGRLFNGGAAASTREQLLVSITHSHHQVSKRLILQGADVNAVSRRGDPPLCVAARGVGFDVDGHMEILGLLLDSGAALEATDSGGYTAFLRAAEWGRLSTMQLLKQRGADVHRAVDAGNTALHLVGRSEGSKKIEYLAKLGLPLDVRNKAGLTPLHKYIYKRLDFCDHEELEPLAAYLRCGADPNSATATGATALHLMVEEGDYELDGFEAAVHMLLKAGADPTLKDHKGKTPWERFEETVKWDIEFQRNIARNPEKNVEDLEALAARIGAILRPSE